MRVELLNVGSFTSPAGLWRKGEDMDTPISLPVPAYLIETETERILVDTGLHPAAATDPERRYGASEAMGFFSFELQASIADQLDLDTLTKVVMTHLHFDHAGGLDLLPASVPVFIQRREWESVRDPGAVTRNFFQPADYACLDGRANLVDGDHDLLGDGSITLLLTPGHTPGHQSLRVGEGLVIGGDVVHYASTLDDRRFPIFADDLKRQAESAEHLRGLRDRGVTVLPGHDPTVIRPGPIGL